MACIVMRLSADPLDVAAVKGFCAGKLARYKVPRYVHVVDGFPMTVTGKGRKVEMRSAAVDVLGLSDAAAVRSA
jgi:fatty-acyl-CoA synthase